MSINQIVVGTMAVVGLGGISAFAATNPTIQTDFKNVQTAITNKDLNAYKTAKNQLISDKTTAEANKVNATTQDQLNTMSDSQAKRLVVQTAITNNDYNAFKANADANMLKRTPDQASFDKLVASQKAHTAENQAMSDAIKNNDFNAFKTAQNTEQTSKQNDPNEVNNGKRPTPTDAQLQTRFDAMVAKYKADGSLPTDNKGMGIMGGRHGDNGFGEDFGDKGNNRGGKNSGKNGGNFGKKGQGTTTPTNQTTTQN